MFACNLQSFRREVLNCDTSVGAVLSNLITFCRAARLCRNILDGDRFFEKVKKSLHPLQQKHISVKSFLVGKVGRNLDFFLRQQGRRDLLRLLDWHFMKIKPNLMLRALDLE